MLYPFYESRIVRGLDFSKTPRHVGVILDGNRRFAKANPSELDPKGHRRGASKIMEFLGWCDEAKVEVVTLWLLSTENFKRTPEELDGLLRIIAETVNELHATGKWNIKAVGALDLLPPWLNEKLASLTPIHGGGVEVNVAIGYGGRREIVDAVKGYLQDQSAQGSSVESAANELTTDAISKY